MYVFFNILNCDVIFLCNHAKGFALAVELNMRQQDLVGILGGKSRVAEILNKKKRLTVDMIRELEKTLEISASILVNNYQLSEK